MPTYEYACRSCEARLEVVQRFSDDPLTTCPECDGALRKVFSPVGIAFKGSGFYKTDSRGGSASSSSTGSGSGSGSSGSDGSSSGSGSSPAAASGSEKAASSSTST